MPFDFIPSANQQAIFDFVARGKGSANVIAVAGAGKTTTVTECQPLIPEHRMVLLVAFNKKIADALNEKLNALRVREGRPFKNFSAKTFHSLAYGALVKRLGGKLNVDGRKIRKLIDANFSADVVSVYGEFVNKLVGLARGDGIGCLIADTDAAWLNLITHHDLTLDSDDATEEAAIEMARKVLRLSCDQAVDDRIVDFDDMLYMPLKLKLKLWQHDFVFIDEAQDTNPVRRALAKLSLRPGGRLIAVGDPKQAIYGFTGASHDAMDLIRREFNAIELPLDVSYRCARAVVAKAQEVVSHIKAHENAPEGSVEELDIEEAIKVLTQRDAILCRQTAPLVELAYTLIARRVACTVLGREIGEGLIALITAQKAKGIDRLLEKLHTYRTREIAKFTARGEEHKAEGVSDRVACLEIIINSLPETDRTVPALVRAISDLFTDKTGVLTLATCHKAKGLEWPTVAILKPELMPSKWARQDWQYQQELNLMYVAWTRAMTRLIFLSGKVQK